MASTLTDIADRLTPSSPIEITYGSQPIAAGAKNTTLVGHASADGGTGVYHELYSVVNVGDADAAKAEVEVLTGAGSELGEMAYAFVAANALAGRSNFPAFAILILPLSETTLSQDALQTLKSERSDMIVSSFPLEDHANNQLLIDAAVFMSGVDRDMQGQFGSFVTAGSLAPLAVARFFGYNSRQLLQALLTDTCNDNFELEANLSLGSNVVPYTALPAQAAQPAVAGVDAQEEVHFLEIVPDNLNGGSLVLGFEAGQTQPISGANGPVQFQQNLVAAIAQFFPGVSCPTHNDAGYLIQYPYSAGHVLVPVVISNTLQTSVGQQSVAIVEFLPYAQQTVGSPAIPAENATGTIYPGALVSGTGIPDGTKVVSVSGNSFTMSEAASQNGNQPLAIQNVVSQPHYVVAAGHAGGMMSSAQPYNPLQGVQVGGLIPPKKRSDRITIDPNGPSEAALKAGLSPLAVQVGGKVAFVRTRVSLVYLPDGVTRYTDYIDWQQIVPLYDFREVIYQVTQNPPFNNNPGGTKASAQNLALFNDEVLREAFEFEKVGMFQNVKLLAKYFQSDIPSRGRFDVKVPVDAVPGLYVMAANIQAISDALSFTI